MRKIAVLLSITALTVSISGCSSVNEQGATVAPKDGFSRWAYIQELPDGRSVICAATVEALSCDWANAK